MTDRSTVSKTALSIAARCKNVGRPHRVGYLCKTILFEAALSVMCGAVTNAVSNYQYTGQFPIFPLYRRSSRALSRLALLITSHLISSSIPFSLLTANFIPLKLSFFHLTIILSILSDISKLPVFVYSISPLPLTPMIMLFSWIAYLYSLEFMVLHLTGSNPIKQSLFGRHWRCSIGKCGRLSRFSADLVRL